jgi:hypothetical protein
MDKIEDPRLTTRHFDLLIAASIAWQMKDRAEVKEVWEDDEPEIRYNEIGI